MLVNYAPHRLPPHDLSFWERIEYSDLETAHLASIDLDIAMRDIYGGVPLDVAMRGPNQS